MAVDTLIVSREVRSLRAEVAALRNEFAKMQSVFQDVQEQYAYAIMEIANLIKTLGGEIKNDIEQNKIEIQDDRFKNILGLPKKFDGVENEFVKMQSVFQDVQEQYAYAAMEIVSLIKTLGGEIKNDIEQNKIEIQDDQFKNILGLSKKFDDAKKGLTESLSQSLLNVQTDFQQKFSELKIQSEKIFDRQNEQSDFITDLMNENFGNHFGSIENSLAAQQKMFGEILSLQNSILDEKFDGLQKKFTEKILNVGENVSIVQKNFSQLSSEVDEIISKSQKALLKNQKDFLKKIDSTSDKHGDIFKTLNAIEELLRLIAANQMIADIQNEISSQNQNTDKKISPQENYSSNSYSGGRKSISIYGRAGAGKTTLATVLKSRMKNISVKKIAAIDTFRVYDYPTEDVVIYVIDEAQPNLLEIRQFIELNKHVKKLLLVVNVTGKFPDDGDREIFSNFQYSVGFSSVDWSKIYVIYAYLKGAQNAWENRDYGSIHESNFAKIEDFINRNF